MCQLQSGSSRHLESKLRCQGIFVWIMNGSLSGSIEERRQGRRGGERWREVSSPLPWVERAHLMGFREETICKCPSAHFNGSWLLVITGNSLWVTLASCKGNMFGLHRELILNSSSATYKVDGWEANGFSFLRFCYFSFWRSQEYLTLKRAP